METTTIPITAVIRLKANMNKEVVLKHLLFTITFMFFSQSFAGLYDCVNEVDEGELEIKVTYSETSREGQTTKLLKSVHLDHEGYITFSESYTAGKPLSGEPIALSDNLKLGVSDVGLKAIHNGHNYVLLCKKRESSTMSSADPNEGKVKCSTYNGVYTIDIESPVGTINVVEPSDVILKSFDKAYRAGKIEYKNSKTAQLYINSDNELSGIFFVEQEGTPFRIRIDSLTQKIDTLNISTGFKSVEKDVVCTKFVSDG